MKYSIIIPIYNEERIIPQLLEELFQFSKHNEIIVIDDGSNDNSYDILKKVSYVKLIRLFKNTGKGYAIKEGIKLSKYDKIIIYDGDLELETKSIFKLMKLDKENGILSIMGYRFNKLYFLESGLDWGNFIFTTFFNILNATNYKDILCCAKSFYKENINLENLRSNGFDIDVDLAAYLTKNSRNKSINQVKLNYKRRTIFEGKKLKIFDGWVILKRIILNLNF